MDSRSMMLFAAATHRLTASSNASPIAVRSARIRSLPLGPAVLRFARRRDFCESFQVDSSSSKNTLELYLMTMSSFWFDGIFSEAHTSSNWACMLSTACDGVVVLGPFSESSSSSSSAIAGFHASPPRDTVLTFQVPFENADLARRWRPIRSFSLAWRAAISGSMLSASSSLSTSSQSVPWQLKTVERKSVFFSLIYSI